jgi:hypothetical protein
MKKRLERERREEREDKREKRHFKIHGYSKFPSQRDISHNKGGEGTRQVSNLEEQRVLWCVGGKYWG